ncbi:MAG: hypothetical protein EU521_00595 [Promethearchaeota archaeon]|nr:MAG: hypothetical protein EU521_00595 [Candidatus Lokiarchaeota archaeon]
MSDKSSTGKVLLIIGGILGILSILLYFISNEFGAWWQVTYEILNSEDPSYMSAFGTYSTAEELDLKLGFYGVIGAILMLVGSVLLFITLSNESKALAIIGSIMMVSCIVLFLVGLGSVTEYESILEDLNFLTGNEYSVYFGQVTFIGTWTWGLSIGFFLGLIATIIGFIGAIMV